MVGKRKSTRDGNVSASKLLELAVYHIGEAHAALSELDSNEFVKGADASLVMALNELDSLDKRGVK